MHDLFPNLELGKESRGLDGFGGAPAPDVSQKFGGSPRISWNKLGPGWTRGGRRALNFGGPGGPRGARLVLGEELGVDLLVEYLEFGNRLNLRM